MNLFLSSEANQKKSKDATSRRGAPPRSPAGVVPEGVSAIFSPFLINLIY